MTIKIDPRGFYYDEARVFLARCPTASARALCEHTAIPSTAMAQRILDDLARARRDAAA